MFAGSDLKVGHRGEEEYTLLLSSLFRSTTSTTGEA